MNYRWRYLTPACRLIEFAYAFNFCCQKEVSDGIEGLQEAVIVQPGTVVHGAGTCTPGPIDCEILSLGQDQVETISSGSTSSSFAVTAITVEKGSA